MTHCVPSRQGSRPASPLDGMVWHGMAWHGMGRGGKGDGWDGAQMPGPWSGCGFPGSGLLAVGCCCFLTVVYGCMYGYLPRDSGQQLYPAHSPLRSLGLCLCCQLSVCALFCSRSRSPCLAPASVRRDGQSVNSRNTRTCQVRVWSRSHARVMTRGSRGSRGSRNMTCLLMLVLVLACLSACLVMETIDFKPTTA